MTANSNSALARPLRALARLLDYPDAALQQHASELIDVLSAPAELNEAERAAAVAFVTELGEMDLYDAQSRYIETFDRGRKMSLYMFEHVYGESRDRGPAMIELKRAYSEHGLETDTRELPDFLPVLLEFCAQIPEESARAWLVETTHVLQRVCVRLTERGSGYANALTVLLRLIGADPAPEALTDMAGKEARDDTPAAIDRVWAETPVTFGPKEAHTKDGATRQEPAEFSDDSAATTQGQG